MVSLGCLGHQANASAKSLDIESFMQDRFERDCGVRVNADLYQSGNVAALLESNVVKQREYTEGLNKILSLNVAKIQYRNVPVIKIDYVTASNSRQMQQALYLDLTSATAKQNFSRIQFNNRGKFEIEKDGRFTVIRCTW
jgi:hypothetical protein